jgi:hypothetical protein
MVEYRITAEERARFKRCRRLWDFASPHRRNLQPVAATESTLSILGDQAAALIDCYDAWASRIDDFAPVPGAD